MRTLRAWSREKQTALHTPLRTPLRPACLTPRHAVQEALSTLEMPRFMRRHPKLADAMLREMLVLTKEFETKLLELQAEQERKQPDPPQSDSQSAGASGGDQDDPQEGDEGEGRGDSGAAPDEQDGGGNEQSDDQVWAAEQPLAATRAFCASVRTIGPVCWAVVAHRAAAARRPKCSAAAAAS